MSRAIRLPDTAAGSPVASEVIAASSMASRDWIPRLFARLPLSTTSVTTDDNTAPDLRHPVSTNPLVFFHRGFYSRLAGPEFSGPRRDVRPLAERGGSRW